MSYPYTLYPNNFLVPPGRRIPIGHAVYTGPVSVHTTGTFTGPATNPHCYKDTKVVYGFAGMAQPGNNRPNTTVRRVWDLPSTS